MCVIAGYVDDIGKMQQRVIKVALYNEAPEEKETNQMSDHIIFAVEEILQIPKCDLKVITRDGVALNELTVLKLIGGQVLNPNTNRLIQMPGIYPQAINIKCMSHTLDNTGADFKVKGVVFNRIEGAHARRIYNEVNALFSAPGDSIKMAWNNAAGTSMPSVSKTRWWSREEWFEYILPHLKDGEIKAGTVWFDEWIKERVANCRGKKKEIGANLTKLNRTFVAGTVGYDSKFLITSFVEIAVVVDMTKKVREATYLIEGDGPISVMIIEILDNVKRYFDKTYATLDFPNIRRYIAQAVALKIAPPGYFGPAAGFEPVGVGANAGVGEAYPEDGEDMPGSGECHDLPDIGERFPLVPLLPPLYPGDDMPPLPLPLTMLHNDDEIPHNVAVPLVVGVPLRAPPVFVASDEDLEAAWKVYCLKLSAPFMKYFIEMVMDHNCIPIWNASKLADPLNMQRIPISPSELRSLVAPLVGKLVS